MTIYLAYTEKGKTTIQRHEVWDAELFIDTVRRNADNVKKGIVVGAATEEEYRDANWPKVRKA